jgi:hypothetical protein
VFKAKFALAVLLAIPGMAAVPASAEDDFPITGTYVENQECSPNAAVPRVKITRKEIHSGFGICTILNQSREGSQIAAQIQCQGAGGNVILGDVTFTIHDDKTVEFEDQDHVYSAVLHRCPD